MGIGGKIRPALCAGGAGLVGVLMHGLIVGKTMSGKTTLARLIAGMHRDAGRLVFTLDSMFDQGLQNLSDIHTDDPDFFMRIVWKNRKCTLVIDEGGETIGRYAPIMEKLGTQARHLGHMSIFISQRPVQLPLTMRDQCAWLAAFKIRKIDADNLADDFDEAVRRAPRFEKGQYVIVKPFSEPDAGHIFGGNPPAIKGAIQDGTLSALSRVPGSGAKKVRPDLLTTGPTSRTKHRTKR